MIGPMQVHTTTRLSDRDSADLGLRLLKGHFETTLREILVQPSSRYDVIRLTLAKYNRDDIYIREVFELLHILWAQVVPEYRMEFEHLYSYPVPSKASGVVGHPG